MDDGMGMPDTIALHSYYKEVDGKYLRIQRAASVFMPYVGPSPCSRDTAFKRNTETHNNTQHSLIAHPPVLMLVSSLGAVSSPGP